MRFCIRIPAAGARAVHEVRGFLIADEIMTGFGRNRTMFACEQAGIAPT